VKRKLLTGNAAAAWGARLANVDYVPAFPITPQTEIIETLAGWFDEGALKGRFVTLDSEHSMVTAAASAAVTGVRVFSATSSQGLLYASEMLYAVSGYRVPWVLVNVSRGLSSPVTLEADHNDIFALRDSGFLQLHASTCQEALDMVLMAYQIAEDVRVRLPVIVNIDGFYLSFTREPVEIPDENKAREFIGEFDAHNISFRANVPLSHASAVLQGSIYSYFRYEHHLAAIQAISVFNESAEKFEKMFNRSYALIESYMADGADYVFIMIGSFATKAKEAVDMLREAGSLTGLLRLRMFRPFPEEEMKKLLKGKKAAAVIDQNLAPGKGGVIYTETAAALCNEKEAPFLISYIGGLGGRDITAEEFYEIEKEMRKAAETKKPPMARLLFSEAELEAVRKLQGIAGVEKKNEQRKN